MKTNKREEQQDKNNTSQEENTHIRRKATTTKTVHGISTKRKTGTREESYTARKKIIIIRDNTKIIGRRKKREINK